MFTILSIIFLTIFIFLSGSLIPQFTVLDWLFGLAYFIVDSCGYWRPGLEWIEEYPGLAVFCNFVFPLLISTIISISTVKIANQFWQTSRRCKVLSIAFLLFVFTMLYGFHSDYRNRISRFGYSASNY